MKKLFVPQYFFVLSWLVLFIGSLLFALYSLELDLLLSYLLSINLSAFIIFGHDKRISSGSQYRMSERFQFALALLGGSPALLAGMVIFRHKTKKGKFRVVIPAILLLQGLLVLAFLPVLR